MSTRHDGAGRDGVGRDGGTDADDAVFYFDGRAVSFVPGQSIGAALTAAGVRAWRATRVQERPRGLFCGIGVCFDCLVVVDGAPNERACLRTARPGIRVETQEGTGHGGLGI